MERKHKSRGPGRLILPLWATALLVSLAMILAGCDTTDRMSTFDAEGPVSLLQLNVFYVTLWVSLGIFVVVGSLLVFTIFRFRAPLDLPRDAELPPQTHGNAALEITLTVISVALLIVIAVPTVQGIF
ncbi:MAG: cytochrome c oxidase subunit II, partial [Armatimonadetes bacterium]|nr:cytochrome c oxidase subunit II [Armatimonadota bacterium]